MSTETRGDLKFSGSMTTPGGMYKRVDINGNVTFDGDLDCLDFHVNGIGAVARSLKSGNTRVNGSLNVNGNVIGGDLDVNGECRIDGCLAVEETKARGKLNVRGDCATDKLDVFGQMEIRGNCDAEKFVCKGSFEIEDTLNAEDITINLYGTSRVKEIVGSKITVMLARGDRLGKFFVALFNTLDFRKAHLVVELIEGDEIRLEQTSVKVVRGNRVTVGDGCEIDLVEYRDSFDKTSDASVLKHVKI